MYDLHFFLIRFYSCSYYKKRHISLGNYKNCVVMKQMVMCTFYFGILTSVLFLIRGYNCPVNCTCKKYWASCNLVTCDDEIITYVPFISIHGKLCPQHYALLSHAGGGLHIQLHGSYCYDLQECK